MFKFRDIADNKKTVAVSSYQNIGSAEQAKCILKGDHSFMLKTGKKCGDMFVFRRKWRIFFNLQDWFSPLQPELLFEVPVLRLLVRKRFLHELDVHLLQLLFLYHLNEPCRNLSHHAVQTQRSVMSAWTFYISDHWLNSCKVHRNRRSGKWL